MPLISKYNINIYVISPGKHWMGNLVIMLVKYNTNYTGSPYFIELDDFEAITCLEEPRVIGSHLTVEKLPKQLK